MASGQRSDAHRIIDVVMQTLQQRTSAVLVTRNAREFLEKNTETFPCIYVKRDAEAPTDEEHSRTILANLGITLLCWVRNEDCVEDEVEFLIQAVDNAMMNDIDKSTFGIDTNLIGIESPDIEPPIAVWTMNYEIKYEYTLGSR